MERFTPFRRWLAAGSLAAGVVVGAAGCVVAPVGGYAVAEPGIVRSIA